MKKIRLIRVKFLWVISLIIICTSSLVLAALGEKIDTTSLTDQSEDSRFLVIEKKDPALTLRQYVNNKGIVFGLAWDGITHPDPHSILGTYFKEYQDILKKEKPLRGRRSRAVRSSHLVVERGGHMRNLRGRAYLPDLIPEGVSPNVIK